jgi:hypothetical protein
MLLLKRQTALSLVALLATSTIAAQAAPSGAFFPSVVSVDKSAHTAVLPIRKGSAQGETVWYIVTDASDAGVARKLGVVYAPDIGNIGAAATQKARMSQGSLVFDGAPNFTPTRTYVASGGGFPPSSSTPGAEADSSYSPFVEVDAWKGVINASIVAVGDGPYDVTHHSNTADRVVAIDTTKRTATFVLARGFVGDRAVVYLSTEASAQLPASVERAIYTPKLAKANASAVIPIGVVADGPRSGAPQGLAYLALDTPLGSNATWDNAATIGSPFNVLSLVPNMADPYAQSGYSPLWGVQVVGKSTKRFTNYGDFASAGPKPAGFSVNCPVIAYE